MSPSGLGYNSILSARDFKVNPEYNVLLSTKDNYRSETDTLCGEFTSLRTLLDFEFHGHYTCERQILQDSIIQKVLVGVNESNNPPWLIFTCGPMGAGKGFCMKWLRRNGIIPLSSLVCIDADVFRRSLPEWKLYVKNNPVLAGSLTHAESSLMAEIAQESAMRGRRNVWVDGSLSDTEWALSQIRKVREYFPDYRICIVSVVADEDIILRRCEQRAKSTGRRVPVEKIRKSVSGSAQTVDVLYKEAVDLIIVLENIATIPRLLSINNHPADDEHDWDRVRQFFT